jgi:hypothetical protein
MPSWFAAGLLLPDALDTAAAAAAAELMGGNPGVAACSLPGLQAPAEQQQELLSPSTVQLQQQLAGRQQQQHPRKGWVTQVADGGVLVPVPAEEPLQLEGQGDDALGGLDDPLHELLVMGGRVHVDGGANLGQDEDVNML